MTDTNHEFLAGGGEMGALTRSNDWSKTGMGSIDSWPQSLRTILAVILNSKFPMSLFWGKDRVCFYNDAYRPSLGNNGKHPSILGQRGQDAWPETWQVIGPMVDSILKGGEASWREDQLLPIYRNGKIEDVYWTYGYSPVKDESGIPAGVLVTCSETTDKVALLKKLEESNSRIIQPPNPMFSQLRTDSGIPEITAIANAPHFQVNTSNTTEEREKRFANTVRQVPLGISILRGPNFVVEMANDTYLRLVDKTEESFIGKPLFDSLPEIEETVSALLKGVFDDGIPYYTDELNITLNRYEKQQPCYFSLVFHPLKEVDGKISGVAIVAYEITQAVRAKHLLAESAKEFKKLVMQSPVPMAIFRGKGHLIEMANVAMLKTVWKREANETVGRTLLEAFPELRGQKYPDLLDSVFLNGKVHQEDEAVAFIYSDGELRKYYLDYEYTPLLEKDNSISGIMVTVNDVTARVEARKKVEDAEERARLAAEVAEIATWDLNLQTHEIIHSQSIAVLFGHKPSTKLTHPEILSQIHPDDLVNILEKAFERAMETGSYQYEARMDKLKGTTRWIRAHGKIFFDDNNEPLKMICTLIDITEERNRREILMESEQKFRLLADSMPQFIWTSGTDGILNYFNKAIFLYSGLAEKELIANGWLQIVHPEDREENTKQWIRAVTTGGDFLYEHRFRRFDGEYRWQLSRAIPQRDDTGKIQMWVGTSTDIQEQKTFTSQLENQVLERTDELEQKNSALLKMNHELESFAYISSHDLQEPLRKIQTFASRLLDMGLEGIPDQANSYIFKIQDAANRMQTLIQDLLAYSRTNEGERTFIMTDLNKVVEEVTDDLQDAIEQSHAIIHAQKLCEAPVILFQFRQLLHNLVSNAIKFTLPGKAPEIHIKAEILDQPYTHGLSLEKNKKYFHVSVEDNGIGFDNKYSSSIFTVFQRLHSKEEYSGTGIGLAIVKKIVDNHNGIIKASSETGKGARFDIYLPEH